MRKVFLGLLIISITAILTGCGETVSGVGKDVNRMGSGLSTFFFRQP